MTGTLRAFELGNPTPAVSIEGLGPYDRFTVGSFSGGYDVIALFKISASGNTARVSTRGGVSSNELTIPGSPSSPQIAHDMLYITGYGNGGKTGGTFLLEVFQIGRSGGSLSLNPIASRVGGARGEVESTDLAVVP